MARNDPALNVRLPTELKAFIEGEAARNGCSQNSEVVRAIHERMDRQKDERPTAPTVDRSEATK